MIRSRSIWLPRRSSFGSARASNRDGGGESAALAIEADTLASKEEVEPNDDVKVAMELSTPIQVWGTLSAAGDVDHFSFSAEASQELVFDASAKRIGSSANIVVSITDASGRVWATNNDYLGEADSFLVWKSPHAGEVRRKGS